MGNANDFVNGVYGAQHIAHMSHADDASALVEEPLILVHLQLPVVGHRYDTKTNATLRCLQLPRHDVRMVLHNGDYHLVALLHKLLRKGCSHKVQALRSAAREHYLLYLRRIDELPHPLTRRLVQVSCLLREVMYATMHVGIHIVVFLHQRVNHLPRLLCRSSIVEIYQWFAIHLAAQYREIGPHLIYVVHRCFLSFFANMTVSCPRHLECFLRKPALVLYFFFVFMCTRSQVMSPLRFTWTRTR